MKAPNLFLYFMIGLTIPHADHGQNVFVKMSYAQDRCCNKGCISQVRPGRGELVAKVIKLSAAESIYFEADRYNITQESASKIKSFADKYDGSTTIIGYTDGCGTASYNQRLSSRRATAVRNEFRKYDSESKVTSKAAGEISYGHDPISRRVDITLTTNVNLYAPPPKIVADVYLIDASLSMAGKNWKMFKRSIEFHRPRHAKVYISTTQCIPPGVSMGSIKPFGPTEIWFSYWSVLNTMSNGQTLAIISDFDSHFDLTPGEHRMLEHKARTKNIKVIAVKL